MNQPTLPILAVLSSRTIEPIHSREFLFEFAVQYKEDKLVDYNMSTRPFNVLVRLMLT